MAAGAEASGVRWTGGTASSDRLAPLDQLRAERAERAGAVAAEVAGLDATTGRRELAVLRRAVKRFRAELVDQNTRAWTALWPLTGMEPGAAALRVELEVEQRRLVAALDHLADALRGLERSGDRFVEVHDLALVLSGYVAAVLPPHDRAVRDRVLVRLSERLPADVWDALVATIVGGRLAGGHPPSAATS